MPLFVTNELRSSIQSISEPFRTLLSLLSLESKDGRRYSLFKGLTTLILFTCSMQICILLSSESPFGWLCMTSHSLSPLIPSDISLACHDSSPVFRLSLRRFKLSQEVSLIPFPPLFSVFLAIFHCIFRLLAFPSQDGHLLPFSPTLTLLLTIPRFANRLLVLFMSYALASSLISTKWF